MKIETKGSQAFNVPNNYEGMEFIRLFKLFNNKCKFKIRGRGSRLTKTFKNTYHSELPLKLSKWAAIYIQTKTDWRY